MIFAMDINLFSVLSTSIFVIFLFHKLWNMFFTTPKQALNLPPGPRKLPLLGNIHNMVGCLPHHRLTELATQYGPLIHLKLGELSVVIVSSAETAKQCLKVHDINFASRPQMLAGEVFLYNYNDIVSTPYGEYWRQMRKIFTVELLSSKRVQSFRDLREAEVGRLVEEIGAGADSGAVINLSEMLFASAYRLISKAAFGDKDKRGDKFIEIIEKLVELTAGFSVADLFPSVKLIQKMSPVRRGLEKIHRDADEVLEDILREHRTAKERGACGEEKDLVDVLLNLQEHGNKKDFELTDDSIKALIQDCFLGGIETGSTTIQWALSEMLKNPRVLRKAQAEVRELHDRKGGLHESDFHELTYMNLVLRESFRMHPPLPLLLPHMSIDKCVINGYEIPARSHVFINVGGIGRDPRSWKDPNSFNPERFLDGQVDFKGAHFELLPFGGGRRICPGMSFGIASVEIELANLLCYFDWKLPGGRRSEELDMTEAIGSAVRRKTDLLLVLRKNQTQMMAETPQIFFFDTETDGAQFTRLFFIFEVDVNFWLIE